jgi:superfamily II DNA or RNA helicase
MISIYFDNGTLLLKNSEQRDVLPELITPYCRYDERVKMFRSEAWQYASIILSLHKNKIPFNDEAKDFLPLELSLQSEFTPRDHQAKALDGWLSKGARGVVVMPTGSGKSYLAVLAIMKIQRPTLIIVPTIDLMQQWATQLESFFGIEVGMLGGGSKTVCDITVSTYDSAVLRMEFIGNRFGFIVFDECHHLPGPVNRLAASMCIAPYRLGLTATPDHESVGEEVLLKLVGEYAYQIHIDELEGSVLAPYKTHQVFVELNEEEQKLYDLNRGKYINFIKAHRINFSRRDGWSQFIMMCARMPNGREVLNAYLKQKKIAQSGYSKIEKVWEIIQTHHKERIIIFTADNSMAYELGRLFLSPVLTHHTKVVERKRMLEKFRSGEYSILITSKVLNEGVDVPEASVGVIVSGSGSIREHVQRLGRILRAKDGKQAVLYELISLGTSETYTSQRRREHRAYR